MLDVVKKGVKVTTIFETIKKMNIEEMAKFLLDVAEIARNSPAMPKNKETIQEGIEMLEGEAE